MSTARLAVLTLTRPGKSWPDSVVKSSATSRKSSSLITLGPVGDEAGVGEFGGIGD